MLYDNDLFVRQPRQPTVGSEEPHRQGNEHRLLGGVEGARLGMALEALPCLDREGLGGCRGGVRQQPVGGQMYVS